MLPGMLEAMTDQRLKTRETRLRNAARRQGMTLHKSRQRDRRALLFGRYWLVDTRAGIVHGAEAGTGLVGDWPGLDLDEVENILNPPD